MSISVVELTGEIRTFSRNQLLVDKRRRHIAQCASKLFAKKGYEATTMQEVGQVCGMGMGSIYYYVGSKKDLIYLILHFSVINQSNRFEEMADAIVQLAEIEALREYIRMYLEHVDETQDLYIFLEHIVVHLDRSERQVFFDTADRNTKIFEELLNKGNDSGTFRTDDPHFTAANIVRTADAWALKRWHFRQRYSLAEYTRKTTEFVLSAIGANANSVTSG